MILNIFFKPSGRLAGLLFLACAIFSACTSSSGKNSLSASSPSQEMAAGQAIHNQIMSDYQPYADPKINEYVQGIVYKLAAHAKRKNLSYRITILTDDRIYAISAPGGEIFITTAFLNFLKNEAELAAVLGHEIGELQFLNPQFDPFRKTIDGVTQAGQMIGPFFGQFGALASLGLVALHAAYARDPDLEKRVFLSDRWAMQNMLEAGYDPQALVDVMTHFAKYDRENLTMFYDYYQSRPITVKRVEAANAEFKKLKLEGRNLETYFDRYRKKTESLQALTN